MCIRAYAGQVFVSFMRTEARLLLNVAAELLDLFTDSWLLFEIVLPKAETDEHVSKLVLPWLCFYAVACAVSVVSTFLKARVFVQQVPSHTHMRAARPSTTRPPAHVHAHTTWCNAQGTHESQHQANFPLARSPARLHSLCATCLNTCLATCTSMWMDMWICMSVILWIDLWQRRACR